MRIGMRYNSLRILWEEPDYLTKHTSWPDSISCDTLCFTQKNRHGDDSHSRGFLFHGCVRHRTEPGMSDWCLIGPDGLLLQRYIKEWELYHPFDLMLAMIG